MPISASDISLVYSGGVNNQIANNSIGGDPSIYEISPVINNLFSDVTGSQSLLGSLDYRCFYVFNDNPTITLLNSKIWIDSQIYSGSDIDIGIIAQNDSQLLEITGEPTGGTIVLSYTYIDSPDTRAVASSVNFTLDSAAVAEDLQTALNSISPPVIQHAEVAAVNNYEFSITFDGTDSNKYFKTLNIQSQFFTGGTLPSGSSGTGNMTITKITSGSPINTIASETGNVFNPPVGISFSLPVEGEELPVGDLRPGEGFPVWVRRTTPSESAALLNDNFIFVISGESNQ